MKKESISVARELYIKQLLECYEDFEQKLKDKTLVRDSSKISALRKSNPKKEKIFFDVIKELLSKWIANEGPAGGIKGVIKNTFNLIFAKELIEHKEHKENKENKENKEKIDYYKEYCTLFFVIEAILKVF